MTARIRFSDPRLRDDLATYFGRAGRIEGGGVRVQEVPGAVAFWVPVLRPMGLLDRSPLIIGVRAIPAEIVDADDVDRDDGRVDIVVPLRGFLDRLARDVDGADALELPIPPERRIESWTGRRPPLQGWEPRGELDTARLTAAANEGIAAVAESDDQAQGRTDAWARELPDFCGPLSGDARPPAGIAFAGHALGFWTGGRAAVYAAPGWWRIAAPGGQILAQR